MMFKVININDLKSVVSDQYDLFICFNSFEKRCLSISKYLPIEKIQTALIITNQIELEGAKENLEVLRGIFKDKSDILSIDFSDPIDFADRTIEQLRKINEVKTIKRIFVDVTSFNHETLLILLAIFKEKLRNVDIVYGYNNASEYSTDFDDPKQKWLSRGIGDLRSVLGYSGEIIPSLENMLIVIVGYEYERAARIIDEISPDYLSIGYNDSDNSSTEKNKDVNLSYARLLKNMSAHFEETKDFLVPSNNPFKAYQSICNFIDTLDKKMNITIVPMNNKLSTLGVAMVGLSRPEIQICYAPALVYNTSAYSLPGNQCYLFSIDELCQQE